MIDPPPKKVYRLVLICPFFKENYDFRWDINHLSHSQTNKERQSLDLNWNLSRSKVYWLLIPLFCLLQKSILPQERWLPQVIKQVEVPSRSFFFFWDVSPESLRWLVAVIESRLCSEVFLLFKALLMISYFLIYYCSVWHFMLLIPTLRLRHYTECFWPLKKTTDKSS